MTLELDPEVLSRVKAWMEGPFDPETKAEIQRLMDQDTKALSSAFFKDLSFGTGGMRGLMGIGTNRMNVYTVRIATQGLANYIKMQPLPTNGYSVFIGYDVRENSKLFAAEASGVLAANGIRVFLSREICPTPLVSFACRHMECSAGIVITASHNPPQYNGYKVYWSDGGQVVSPHDIGIMKEVHEAKDIFFGPVESPLVHGCGREIDEAYFKELKKLKLSSVDLQSLNIVYTNLHGTGIRIIPKALEEWGFKTPRLVEAQTAPDPAFTNAPSPNPEEEKALALGTKELLETSSDLLLATDPDADRMGAVARHKGKAVRFTGNQIACLCLEHICRELTQKGAFPENAGFVKSIVTTELFKAIVESFGGTSIDVLTGFKYIGETIRLWENSFGGLQFLFGAEESYGYLFGTFVRDKDAISACCLLSEVAAVMKSKHLTLVDELYAIYRKYGIYRESLTSLTFGDTADSMKEIDEIMNALRSHPPSHIGGIKIVSIEDYSNGSMSLPKSDVMRYLLENGSKLVIRPSGTESKVKIYAEIIEKNVPDNLEEGLLAADERLIKLVNAFQSECLTR